jgi:hypothetical protein
MKTDTTIIIFISLIFVFVWVAYLVLLLRREQQEVKYYSIPELDCYCQIHHVGKRDIFVNIEGDTVAVVNRK